jgi:anti-anti-sigma factor
MGEGSSEATGGEVVLKTNDLLAERIVVEGQGAGVCFRFSGRAKSSEPEYVDGLGELREKIAAQEGPVSLDLTGIEQVNSAFIGLIVGLVAKLDETGRRLAVIGANRQVKDLLGIVGILDALEIRDA